MEYVIDVLRRFFHKNETEALHIMLTVHKKGGRSPAVYPPGTSPKPRSPRSCVRRPRAWDIPGLLVTAEPERMRPMRISPEVEIALSVAASDAARRRHEYVTIEHLLYALLMDEPTAAVFRHAGGDPVALKKRLEAYLSEQIEPLDDRHHPRRRRRSGCSAPSAAPSRT